MKPTRLFALATIAAGLATGQASELLVGWDSFGANSVPTAQTDNAAGFSGTLTQGSVRTGAVGDNDGKFGGIFSGADTGVVAVSPLIGMRTQGTDDTATLVINNNSGSEFTLESFVFDFSDRGNTNGAMDYTVNYVSGDLSDSDGTLVFFDDGGLATTSSANPTGVYDDYVVSLSALSDQTLADGESATFTLVVSDAGSSAKSLWADNLGIVGTAVPEPSSIALLGLGGLALIRRRRK